jgi:hypothetical protein
VRRFALALTVALLTFSASGVAALVISEPCTNTEPSAQDDGACPPMCVTCGCCAQAAEPAVFVIAQTLGSPVADVIPSIHRLQKANPQAILHVPKLSVA